MIPIRTGSISGWAARKRRAPKTSGTVESSALGRLAAPRPVPRAAHMSTSSVAMPAACRAGAWNSPRPSTPSEPWQISTAGAPPGGGLLGTRSLPARVSGGSDRVAKAT